MLLHTDCVIYHALQSLWIDWNKINVVLGRTANIYRVVGAAFLMLRQGVAWCTVAVGKVCLRLQASGC